MRYLFQELARRLSQEEELALVTITASTGATPRGAGARMLVGRKGRICGTIGGGAVEYRAIHLAQEVIESGQHLSRDFSLTREDVAQLGMICGGAVQIFIRRLPSGDAGLLALAREAETHFQAGRALWLIEDLSADGSLSLCTRESGSFGTAYPAEFIAALPRNPQRITWEGRELITDQICSPGRVYLFGAGHVARELEPLLSHLGFRCVVLDDRPEFLDSTHFPTAEALREADFSAISQAVSITPEDYVCIMTRGHAYDTLIQAQVLPLRPAYVGVIGSRKKAAAVRAALREEYGLSDELLDQVTTPIGLPISAESPAEIAVSIAAQLIQVRAMRQKS